MGSYDLSRNHMRHEANAGISASHFPWFYPGNYFSLPKTTASKPSQQAEVNPDHGLFTTSISYIASPKVPKTETNAVPRVINSGEQKPSSKALKRKPPKKKDPSSKKSKLSIIPEVKREKKNPNVQIDISSFDLSGVPSPVCSCTGVARVCYKWGAGGWQSSCCTISISEYPLPMSTARPGARLAGRKMSNGAYVKLLLRLAAEGHDLSRPVDLKNHWARHGTNKFVTIK